MTYYFSDCQTGAATGCLPGSNGNPGTQTLPKQNLAGININALPAGSRLFFVRGGAWNWSRQLFENPNVTPSAPLVLDAYGSGARPVFNAGGSATSAIDFGSYNNTSNDGGYTIRNIKWDGRGTTPYGFFLIHNLRNVVLENNEITGFHIGIHSQGRAPNGVNNVTIRNNDIVRNSSMGILGQFKDTLIEGNLIEGNNFGGSGFDHGSYLSGSESEGSGMNITLRNNRYIRNSAVNGVCQGGNMTFHGQMSNVTIEGNRIEQDAAAAGCWAMSITQGYNTPEWFRNFVVRNNKVINAGNTAINAQSAPGILVEGNVIINTQSAYQTAISVGHPEYQGGDVQDTNATVRNNTACFTATNVGSVLSRVTSIGALLSNNVTITGPAATQGVCAP